MKWLKKYRKKGAFVIIFALMLTILWPLQTGIEIDSTTVPLVQKKLKEALIAATKSAAGQLDQTQLHQGSYVIDPTKATQAFDQIMQANLGVNPNTWEPQTGSAVKSPLHVKLYLYNQWTQSSLPGTASTLLNSGPGSPSDPLYPPLQDVSIPTVSKPTILAYASETYTSFWGKHVVIEQFASAQVDYAFNGQSSSPMPVIQSVTFSGSPYSPTITIDGIGFGGFSTPYTGNPNVLVFNDSTRIWQQGSSTNNNNVTDNITSWSDTQIVVKPSGGYNSTPAWIYEPGDALKVSIMNPQTKQSGTFNTNVTYPFSAGITATSANVSYSSGYNNSAVYQVSIPFSYQGYSSGSFRIDVVDQNGNTVTSAIQSLNTNGVSQISWSTSYQNASATWHLVETDSQGRNVAQSNAVTGAPTAPPSPTLVANTPSDSYQNGYGSSAIYAISLPFTYTGNPGSYTMYVYDRNGNYVTSSSVSLSSSGSSSISWSSTYNNAGGAWHLVEKDSWGNLVATSNWVSGQPVQPPSIHIYKENWAGPNSDHSSFSGQYGTAGVGGNTASGGNFVYNNAYWFAHMRAIDLGNTVTANTLVVNNIGWVDASSYPVQVSNDGVNWRTIGYISRSNGNNSATFYNVTFRYLMLNEPSTNALDDLNITIN